MAKASGEAKAFGAIWARAHALPGSNGMRIGIYVALVLSGLVANADAELSLLSIPGNSTGGDIKQGSISENTFI